MKTYKPDVPSSCTDILHLRKWWNFPNSGAFYLIIKITFWQCTVYTTYCMMGPQPQSVWPAECNYSMPKQTNTLCVARFFLYINPRCILCCTWSCICWSCNVPPPPPHNLHFLINTWNKLMAPVIRQKNYGPQNLGHKWGGGVGGEGVRGWENPISYGVHTLPKV